MFGTVLFLALSTTNYVYELFDLESTFGSKSPIMKIRYARMFFLLVAVLPFCSKAQMLEQIDMSTTTNNYNTYLTGINNSGWVTGYYNNGSNIGFIITPGGKRLIVDPFTLGYTDTKVESINNNGVAVITANVGSTVGIYKCYVDTLGDSISHFVQVTGLVQPSSVAFDINNKNDISGWFQSTYRYLWVKHDSIIPGGNSAYESAVFQTSGPTYFNTMAGGINDYNKVAGFYIDGSTINPFIYDNLLHTFNPLSTAFKIRLWDINNTNWVAGEYLQTTNNVYMAFIADVSTGGFSQFTSLASIFDTNTIQSVANGINDSGVVVGSFMHPGLGIWVGFVYRPGIDEVRIPGFDYNSGTWKLVNNTGVANTVWPQTYYGGFDYDMLDPYVNNGTPLMDAFLDSANPNLFIPDSSSVDWLSFANEVDQWGYDVITNPFIQSFYHNIVKHVMFDKYKTRFKPFAGHCYGFTYTQLLRHFDDPLFSSWFNIPGGTNISQVNNTDNDAVQAIARMYFRQNDVATLSQYSTGGCYQNKGLWNGLREMKNEFMKPFATSNPRSLSFQTPNGYHSVMPYKIRTPKKLPFDHPTVDYDTVFIHDSNYPLDSTKHIRIESYLYEMPHAYAHSSDYTVNFASFNKISIRELMAIPHTELKSTSAGDDPKYTFATDGSYYTISTGSGQAVANGSGYTNNTTELLGLEYETFTSDAPSGHMTDTANTASFNTYNYSGPTMQWRQHNKRHSMGISRMASNGQSDNGEVAKKRISYGNPDAATKYLNCYYNELTDDQSQGASILATGVCAAQGDSIVTESETPFTYTITKVNGTTNCIYNLTVFAAYNGDTMKEFHSSVPIEPNSTHTIDPYFNGTTEIAVVIDNGNDGQTDDTLFVAGWPINIENVIKEGGIKIYPNPVRDELTLEFASAGTYGVHITDIVGKTVYNNTLPTSGKIQLPMGQYAPGVYLIQVSDGKGTVLLEDKLIIQ